MKIHEIPIYIIGFMGAGKSTVAGELVRSLGLQLAEMDELLVEREGMSVSEIFARKGESYFRQKETELLRELGKPGMVISCGGGVAMRQENVQLMKERGRIVLLRATPETVFERVRYNTGRPLLNGDMSLSHVRELLEARRPYYEAAADIFVDTDGKTPGEICSEIIRKINE